MASLATPPPGGTDTGFDAGLGAALNDAYDAAVGDSGGAPSEGGEETPQPAEGADVLEDATEWQPETEPVQATSQEVKPSTQPAQPAQAPAAEPYPLSPDGKSYIVPKAELAQLGTVRQYFDGVSRFFQTPEAAGNAYAMSSDFQMMQNDWLNGSDASIDAMMSHWAGANYADNPVMQQRFNASFTKMAERAPQMLKATNPTAYRSMLGNLARFNGTIDPQGQIQWGDAIAPASGLALELVNQAYDQAAQTQSPFDMRRAQELDYAVTGTFKNELPKIDPQAQQRAQFEREQAAFRAQQSTMEANVTNAWNAQNVEGAKFKALDQEIDKILTNYRQKSGISDQAYADMKAGIVGDLVGRQQGRLTGKLAESDPEWAVLHEQEYRALVNEFRQGWQNDPHGQRVQARVDPYLQSFLSRSKRLIPALAKARIESKKPAAPAPARRPASAPAATSTTPGQQAARVTRADADDWWNDQWKGIRAAV